MKSATDTAHDPDDEALGESDQVFSSAAELFRLLSTPIRLKIISALCQTEKNVSQLLHEIDTTQPNMSQHLSTLYRAGVLSAPARRDADLLPHRQRAGRLAVPRGVHADRAGGRRRRGRAGVRAADAAARRTGLTCAQGPTPGPHPTGLSPARRARSGLSRCPPGPASR